jgi:hypothetical protein
MDLDNKLYIEDDEDQEKMNKKKKKNSSINKEMSSRDEETFI